MIPERRAANDVTAGFIVACGGTRNWGVRRRHHDHTASRSALDRFIHDVVSVAT